MGQKQSLMIITDIVSGTQTSFFIPIPCYEDFLIQFLNDIANLKIETGQGLNGHQKLSRSMAAHWLNMFAIQKRGS